MLVEMWGFVHDYARFAGRRGIAGALLVLAGALCEGIGLALLVPLVGIILAADGGGGGRLQHIADEMFGFVGAHTLLSRMAILLSVFVVVIIIRAATLLARDVTLAKLRIGFVEGLRVRIARCLTQTSWDRLANLQHARVSQVISGDIQQVGNAAQFLTQGISAVAMLLVQTLLAFYLAPALALLICCLLLIAAFTLRPMMRRARLLGTYIVGAGLKLMHNTTQFLGGLKLAVSQNLQKEFLNEFEATLKLRQDKQIAYLRQQTENRLALVTLSALIGAALVLMGVSVFRISPAVLTVLLLIIGRMSGPFGQIQQGGLQLANALPAYEKAMSLLNELADLSEHEDDAAGRSDAGDIAGKTVRFSEVTFFHPCAAEETECGVEGISLDIAPGSFLGVCGASGSGKTTFADLLAGLFPPQSGSIRIGDAPLRGTLLRAWRDRLAYVAQDSFLFHASVRRNLAWGNPQATENDMWQALTLVEADEFVWAMANGLDTDVGERGMLVSGGERQRLALARAILRRPQFLILDEATNAVDPDMEMRILGRVLSLTPRPTIVMIAHRPESLSRCDRIVTMKAGRLK